MEQIFLKRAKLPEGYRLFRSPGGDNWEDCPLQAFKITLEYYAGDINSILDKMKNGYTPHYGKYAWKLEKSDNTIKEHDECLLCKHCHSWWSEYFWTKEHNPLDKEVWRRLIRDLFRNEKIALMTSGKDESGNYKNITTEHRPQDYVADSLEYIAKQLRATQFRFKYEYLDAKDTFVCPKCGQKPSLIDRWDW